MAEIACSYGFQPAHLRVGKELLFEFAEPPFHGCTLLRSKSLTGNLCIIVCNDDYCKQTAILTGYYKLYAAKKDIRIVYRIIEQEVIVEIVAIGKREEPAVYRTSRKRIR